MDQRKSFWITAARRREANRFEPLCSQALTLNRSD